MTNKEKNEKRFDELGIGDLPAREIAHRIAVTMRGKIFLCKDIPCYACIFAGGDCDKEKEEWLEDETRARETGTREEGKDGGRRN